MTDTDDFLARVGAWLHSSLTAIHGVKLVEDVRRLHALAKAGQELYRAARLGGGIPCALCEQFQVHDPLCAVAAYEQTLADEKAVTE